MTLLPECDDRDCGIPKPHMAHLFVDKEGRIESEATRRKKEVRSDEPIVHANIDTPDKPVRAKRCIFFHKFTKWVKSEWLTYNRTNPATGKKIIEGEPVQERTCLKCGRTEVRRYGSGV